MSGSLIQRIQKLGINGFLLGIILSGLLAYLFPDFGSRNSVMPWQQITSIGISFIFFFYGVKLDPNSLRRGLSNWKLHLLVQSCTYLIYPAAVYAILFFVPEVFGELKTGILFLAALPSTVSASVVLVSLAKGNIPAAIFNASISSLIGVFLTPALLFLLADYEAVGMDFTQTLGQLSIKILIPVFLGIFLHRWLYPLVEPLFGKLKYLDQIVIMIIVYTSFSEAFSNHVFDPFTSDTILFLIGLTAGLYFVMVALILLVSRILGFGHEDRITAVYCGSKKSLIQGVVMGKVIFPDPIILSLSILPIMLLHIQQLIYGSVLINFFNKKRPPEEIG